MTLAYVARPTSSLHCSDQSLESSGVISINCISRMTLKTTARQLETAARRYLVKCAAAQPRSLERTLFIIRLCVFLFLVFIVCFVVLCFICAQYTICYNK